MAKNGRPPMKAARDHADKVLRVAYGAAWNAAVEEYLTERGWEQITTSTVRWAHNPEEGK